ncbi:MAG: carboxypeptidase-like regulatory domain-containing protein [Flammeovirgaceae bacterium]|nr:MAG: carboxypeptidase-like regulatory domain-containing protein [Flammeovirgaceae bacterium]
MQKVYSQAWNIRLTCLGFLLALTPPLFAGGIRGTVKADDGTLLSYATIYVKQAGTGTTTNVNGYYELSIPPGNYNIVYQYLGYETQERQVTVAEKFEEINIVMKQQVIVLQQVTISSGNEDPAYTIMRKAIAKAKYHTQQIDSFSARVYIKGAGKLKDYPWLAKKALEKEGIKKDRVFISESVSEIRYRRPATFSEKVISIRSDGKDNNTSPNAFIFGSFYQPVIAETVSPLSPAAFGYYKFEYQGTFKDRNYDISRIKVTPRSRGDNVVEGTIYIVEDWWSIHSLDVITTKLGVKIGVKQVYAPIDDKAWLPVSQQFVVDGRFFGFEFEYNYLATVSDYKIMLNPELVVETMEVIDDKLHKEQAKEIEKKFGQKNQQLQERMASGKEITRKELKTILKEYEKEERKELKEPEVLYNTSFKVDSGAYKKDSAYWSLIRPVPLTLEEVKGYKITDSIAIEEKKREEGDTIKRAQKNKKGFQPWDLIVGDYYKISKHSNLQIEFPQVWFNTVEGFNLIYRLNYGIIVQDTNRTHINIRPTFRYAFSRETASGTLRLQIRNRNHRFELEGGRYIRQFNADEPILPVVNTFTTLFLEQNWMKIYERDFIALSYRKRFSPKYSAETTWSWAQRRELFNTTNYKWIDRDKIEDYTPNAPVNAELINTGFAEHYAFIGSVGLSARPWLKYRIRNGRKAEIENSSPTFNLYYEKGFTGLQSELDFDRIEIGGRHEFGIGVRGRMHLALRGGAFLNADSLAFIDFKHFLGNRTPLATTDPIGSFRLLDYYIHSTADKYLIANMHYQFRRFLVSSIYEVRMLGIRENIFVNYLATPTSRNYTELGYSINGILRFFRIEAAVAFQDGKYQSYGFRFGIATNLAVRFSDN